MRISTQKVNTKKKKRNVFERAAAADRYLDIYKS